MPLTHFYVSGEASTTQPPEDHHHLRWPTATGKTDTVKSAIGWWLPSLGSLPTQAIDLVRIAGGAYRLRDGIKAALAQPGIAEHIEFVGRHPNCVCKTCQLWRPLRALLDGEAKG